MDMIIDIEADELAMDLPHDPKILIVDVRRETEYADGHVKEAINMPLSEMTDVAYDCQHRREPECLYALRRRLPQRDCSITY